MQPAKFTEDGVRALIRLTSPPGRLFNTAKVANEFRLSQNHLVKIVRRLAETGFVERRRGKGGFWLAKAADASQLGNEVPLPAEPFSMVERLQPAEPATP